MEAEVKFSPGTTPQAGTNASTFEGEMLAGEDGDPDPSQNGKLKTNPMEDAQGSPLPVPKKKGGGGGAGGGGGGAGGAGGLPGAGGGPGGPRADQADPVQSCRQWREIHPDGRRTA